MYPDLFEAELVKPRYGVDANLLMTNPAPYLREFAAMHPAYDVKVVFKGLLRTNDPKYAGQQPRGILLVDFGGGTVRAARSSKRQTDPPISPQELISRLLFG